jgi:hypothetical protein
MAVTPVMTKRQFETRSVTPKRDPLSQIGGLVGAAGSIVGGAASSNPFMIGAGILGGVQALRPAKSFTERIEKQQDPLISSDDAISRRVQFSNEDPLNSLREAKAALSLVGIDPQTRKLLEKPLLQALSTRAERTV